MGTVAKPTYCLGLKIKTWNDSELYFYPFRYDWGCERTQLFAVWRDIEIMIVILKKLRGEQCTKPATI